MLILIRLILSLIASSTNKNDTLVIRFQFVADSKMNPSNITDGGINYENY